MAELTASVTGAFGLVVGIIVAVAVGLSWRPRFTARPLLNRSEIKLRSTIARMLPRGFLLMAQVSYGEMLANKSRSRYLTVNSKRADMVICDYDFNPLVVIEYQGAGHNGTSWRSLIDTRRRDRKKRIALK